MRENENVEAGYFGVGFFFLGIFGMYFLVSGLMKQDLIFRIAVFGPLLAAALGLFIVLFSVDLRHNLSSSLLAFLSARFPRMSDKERSRMLDLLLLFFIGNMAWLSGYLLPLNQPSAFGITLFLAVTFLSLFFGKWLSSSRLSSSLLFDNAEPDIEFTKIANALLSDAQHGLNPRQRMMVTEQQVAFRHRLLDIENSPVWARTVKSMNAVSSNKEQLRKKLLNFHASESEALFTFVVNNRGEFKPYELRLLEAEFLIESLSEMLNKLAKDVEASDQLRWNFGSLLGEYMARYHAQRDSKSGLPPIEAGGQSTHKIWGHAERLFSKVLDLDSTSLHRNWDPYFLCSFQKRLTEMLSVLTHEEKKQIMEIGRKQKPTEVETSWFRSVYFLLGAISSSSLPRTSGMLSSVDFLRLDVWPRMMEESIGQTEFERIAKPILTQLPLQGKTFVHQLLMLILVLSFNVGK